MRLPNEGTCRCRLRQIPIHSTGMIDNQADGRMSLAECRLPRPRRQPVSSQNAMSPTGIACWVAAANSAEITSLPAMSAIFDGRIASASSVRGRPFPSAIWHRDIAMESDHATIDHVVPIRAELRTNAEADPVLEVGTDVSLGQDRFCNVSSMAKYLTANGALRSCPLEVRHG